MRPQFSVIIPTYNRADCISRAINSVLNQTCQDFEIIVVDDASTDRTANVVAKWNDDRIRYICLPQNRGVAAARNAGIKKAKGNYISFLDSDDEFASDFLRKTLNILQNSGDKVGFSWTGTIYISEKNTDELKYKEIVERLWTPAYASREEAYTDCLRWDPVWGTGHGVTIKSNVFDTIGLLDEQLLAREDIDLLIRLIKEFDFRVIPEYLVTIHSGSRIRVDGHHLNKARAYIKIYQKNAAAIENNPAAFVFFNQTIADNFSRAGYYWQAVKYLSNIARKNPRESVLYKKIGLSVLHSVKKKITLKAK